MYLPFGFLITFGFTLVAANITVFTFAVTLLGKAIELAKNDVDKAQLKKSQNFQEQISDLENGVKEAKEDGNSQEIEKKLESIRKDRQTHEQNLRLIKRRYSYLNFPEAVMHPNLFFILAILLAFTGKGLDEKYLTYISYIFLAGCIFLFIGIFRFCKTLRLVQEISSKQDKKSDLEPQQIADMVKNAVAQHDEELKKKNEERLDIKFITEMPLNCNKSQELDIKFKISLSQGRNIKDVGVWFFVPDDIQLIFPTEESSWRQDSDYSLPNIKTAKIIIGNVSIGANHPRTLKIKAPSKSGIYPIYYRLYGEGYVNEREKFELLVS